MSGPGEVRRTKALEPMTRPESIAIAEGLLFAGEQGIRIVARVFRAAAYVVAAGQESNVVVSRRLGRELEELDAAVDEGRFAS